MLYAFVSDIHGRRRKLEVVLAQAREQGTEQFVSLGDVGGDECLALLHQAGARTVFGNYEVSGWRRLTPENRAWVRDWPPLLAEDHFWAVHSAPWWPEGLRSVEDFGQWLKRTGHSWRALFPYLTEDENHLWRALAYLESANRAVLFHGHTHQQAIWQWGPAGHLQKVRQSTITIETEHRYIVGVGSVGLPEDGAWATYTLYDTDNCQIQSIRLDRDSRSFSAGT